MSHYPPPATLDEWRRAVAAGGYATFDGAPGHHLAVATPGHIQARCGCGWNGPDRTTDTHAVGLVVDDVDWHMERVAADARALAATLAVGPPTRMWWER